MIAGQFLILFKYMLLFSVALSFVALGGMFSERSGVINIGLEGTMCVAGFVGVKILTLIYGKVPNFLCVVIVILVAILAGMLYSLLLAVACIRFNADQTLIGTALNILATAVVLVLCKKGSAGGATTIEFVNTPFNFKIGEFQTSVFFPICLVAIAVSAFVLFKTRFGLRLRSCGENPNAAASVGVNVQFYRYIGVLVSGALAGIGALAYVVPAQNFWNSDTGVAGFGFLALAIMIFGAWKPVRIGIVSLIFSFFMSLSFVYSSFFSVVFGITLNPKIFTSDLIKMVPYIVSLVVLAFISKNSRAPKAEGIPYDKGAR